MNNDYYEDENDRWSWDWDDDDDDDERANNNNDDDDAIDVEYEFEEGDDGINEEDEVIFENITSKQNKRRKIAKKATGFLLSMLMMGTANSLFKWAMNIGKKEED